MHVSPNPSRKGVVYDKFGKGTNRGLYCAALFGLFWLLVIPYYGILQARFPECKYMRISSVIRMGFFCFFGQERSCRVEQKK